MPEKSVDSFIKNLRAATPVSRPETKGGTLFFGLSEASLQTLLQNSHIKSFQEGQDILQQGDKVEHLYLIMEGSLKTIRSNEDGKEATMLLLRNGDVAMEDAIFLACPATATLRVMAPSKILMIPATVVRRHALHDQQFTQNLLQILARHYKGAQQQIDSIVTRTPIERLGAYFLKLHIENRSNSMDISLPFPKATIANHLGMTPETFSRALAQIKKMGIDVDHEKLTLRDAYTLCHFCEPDTAHDCKKFNTPECPLCNKSGKCSSGGGCGSGGKCY